MAQQPTDQNFYHHPHQHSHVHSHPQLPPQFRNPFDMLYDERTGAINYNYVRPYIPNPMQTSDFTDDFCDSLVMRRPRRTRTTFTSAQIAELEQHFLQGRYLTSSRLTELSNKLALGTAQVKIWFKNRRRRHKIQSDQQKDLSCDGMMPLSPSMPSSNSEPHATGNHNRQALSLSSSGDSTPSTLTPSPTPSMSSTNLIDTYGESINSFYYNNNSHGMHPAAPHHTQHPHANAITNAHQYPAATAPAMSQFFPSHPVALAQQQHHHHQQQHQPQYHSNQYDFQNKTQGKKDPDYNFNNEFYIQMTAASAKNAATTTSNGTSTVCRMSPDHEVYEPLTSKIDESPSLCNGGSSSVDMTDEMDESNTKTLQLLLPNHARAMDDACGNNGNNDILNLMEDCTGAFSKYTKMSSDTHETNYQCTMDTIMNAYNCHRSTANAQFAYCFN